MEHIKTPVTANPGRLLASADGRCSCCDWTYKELADAARAINAHDALVEALDDIKWTSCERDNMEYSSKITCYQYEAIFNALKLAKGE